MVGCQHKQKDVRMPHLQASQRTNCHLVKSTVKAYYKSAKAQLIKIFYCLVDPILQVIRCLTVSKQETLPVHCIHPK